MGRVSDTLGLVCHAGPRVSTGLDLKAYVSLTGLPFRTLPPPAQRTTPPPRGFLFETPLCKTYKQSYSDEIIVAPIPPFRGLPRPQE